MAIGFPTAGDPIIWDIGTSAIMLAQATLAARTGEEIEPGLAFAADGSSTTGPVAALASDFAAWGEHKGSGLSVMIQMLGFLPERPGSRATCWTMVTCSSGSTRRSWATVTR